MTIGFETAGLPMREMSSLEAIACGRPFFCQNKLHLLNAVAKPLQGLNIEARGKAEATQKVENPEVGSVIPYSQTQRVVGVTARNKGTLLVHSHFGMPLHSSPSLAIHFTKGSSTGYHANMTPTSPHQ